MKTEQHHDHDQHNHDHKEEVKIEIDNRLEHVTPGIYVVSEFKKLLGVPADKDLDQVVNGNLTTLDDSASITIRGGEVFFSHTRRGGAS